MESASLLVYKLMKNMTVKLLVYESCPKSKCTDFLFKCLLDSPEITSYFLQRMPLGKLHSKCR